MTDWPTTEAVADLLTAVVDNDLFDEEAENALRILSTSVRGDIWVTLEDEFGNTQEYRWVAAHD